MNRRHFPYFKALLHICAGNDFPAHPGILSADRQLFRLKDAMDLRKIKTLIDLVRESGIAEMELHEGEDTIKIVNTHAPVAIPPEQMTPEMAALKAATALPVQPAPVAAAPAPAAENTPAAPAGKQITSPMVGTFYQAPSPDAKPFVKVGDSVKKGDTLCIIEAMKLLNEVPAEEDGIIREILVENGQPVEYGQPLFTIG